MMKNIVSILGVLIGLAILGLLIENRILLRDSKATDKDKAEYWKNPAFKTDSVVVEVDYSKLPKPQFKNSIPPAVNIQYIDSTKHVYHIDLNDSLVRVIDSLTNTITNISKDYLAKYPTAPKFIYMELSSDSLTLDLLSTSGQISRDIYYINLLKYAYQWNQAVASVKELDGRVIPNKTRHYYTGIGLNTLAMSPVVELRYEQTLGKKLKISSTVYGDYRNQQALWFNSLTYQIK